MSDFPCDPDFENCDQETESPAQDDSSMEMMKEPGMTVETFNALWGAASYGMVVMSLYYYKQYNYDVENDVKYPYREEGTDDYDKEWAHGTKELTAWSKLVWGWNILHGLGSISWLLNMLLDNEGGQLHYIFYRTVQLNYLALPISALLACNINQSYIQSNFEETTDNTDASASAQSSQYFFRKYLEDPRWTDTTQNLWVQRQYTNQVLVWLAIAASTFVQHASYGPIAQVYEDAFNALEKEDAVEEEEEDEE